MSANKEPWYKDGLKFSCSGCGDCCTGAPGYRSLKEFGNGDCVFFDHDTRHCEVYDLRPRQCRTWPFWDSNLKSPKAWKETCKECPGSGQGKLHQLNEIEERRREVKI